MSKAGACSRHPEEQSDEGSVLSFETLEEMPRPTSSPQWYRNVTIIFLVIGLFLAWAAISSHDWVYWAFAGITLLNAVMSGLKFFQVRESKS